MNWFSKLLLLISFFTFHFSMAQDNKDAVILKFLLTKYYATEKVIVKNRLQLLSFYCNKAANNEETLEVISKSDLLKKNATAIKNQINPAINEDWSKEFSILFTNQHQYLKSKVTNCYSLEEFQKAAEKFKENNQRLMIVSKPMYFANNYCLVKVAFYRSIEHNSGSYFLFENLDGEWKIKETLNEWST